MKLYSLPLVMMLAVTAVGQAKEDARVASDIERKQLLETVRDHDRKITELQAAIAEQQKRIDELGTKGKPLLPQKSHSVSTITRRAK